MPRLLYRPLLLLIAATFFGGILRPACAELPGNDERLIADKIVGWVGEKPILMSELEECLVRYQSDGLIGTQGSARGQLQKALNLRIGDLLILEAAKEASISVSAEVVDNRVDGFLRQVEQQAGGPERLAALLERTGKNREAFREKLREQVREEMTIARAIGSRFSITEGDVIAYEEQRRRDHKPGAHYRISQIFYPLSAQNPEEVWENTLDEARKTRIEAEKAGDFERFVQRYLKEHENAQGGHLGEVTEEEVQPEIARALASLQPGRSAEPVRSTKGIHLIYLHKTISAREFLFAKRYDEEKKKWIAQLRANTLVQVLDPFADGESAVTR